MATSTFKISFIEKEIDIEKLGEPKAKAMMRAKNIYLGLDEEDKTEDVLIICLIYIVLKAKNLVTTSFEEFYDELTLQDVQEVGKYFEHFQSSFDLGT